MKRQNPILAPVNRDAAQERIDRMVRIPLGDAVPLPNRNMRGQVPPAVRAVAAQLRQVQEEQQAEQFRGLMALLAGVELALVDIGIALSMHNPAAKDFNARKAQSALRDALKDFQRSNGS